MNIFERFFQSFFPFFVLGVGIVLALLGIFLFSYLLIGGAIVALVLYCIAWIRNRFLQKQNTSKKKQGRIIEGEYSERSSPDDKKKH